MKVASRWMIANIALDDALILPHRANPTGLNFRERQGEDGVAIPILVCARTVYFFEIVCHPFFVRPSWLGCVSILNRLKV
jgi:hypothetical protein